MNFFEHQDQARRNTRRLIILMTLAVVSLILVTTLLVAVVLHYFNYDVSQPRSGNLVSQALSSLSWELLGYISLGIGSVVAIGSVFKLLQLRAGGRVVAEAMDGRLINLDTRDANERKILNVVEEMAIASGTAVPPVYVIEDPSINAFAAGQQPQDAVIGVTRGCIELLSRDELQGVIAHEFSHILHGDMRLNIRLVGVLHGILLLGLIGYYLLRSAHLGSSRSSRRQGNSALPMIALGLGLMIVGYAGTFFGNIIKAAVSRQREFLADSSAVQFTRNPDGIAGALKKIGGHTQGSLLRQAHAAEFSHMFFGQGISTRFNALMATHPPLEERIRRIQPNWDGKFVPVASSPASVIQPSPGLEAEQVSGFASGAAVASAVDSIGQPSAEHVSYARTLLQSIPDALNEAAHDSFAARALIYSLLISKSGDAVAAAQWQCLEEMDPAVLQHTRKLHPTVLKLERELNLPLLELCIPALKQLSPAEHKRFKAVLAALIRADQRVDVFEWCLYRIVLHNLEPERKRIIGEQSLKELADECRLLIAFVAHCGHDSAAAAEAAFDAGFISLGIGRRFFMAKGSIRLPELDRALDRLKQLKPLQKPILLKALAKCINHDATVTVAERELFRSVADSLDCPVPPLLPGQELS